MEDQSSLLQSNMQEDSFEVVMRGYNKRQVDDYVLQCQHHIRDLAQRLALAEQEIERVRTESQAAIEKASSKPVHEEVSERLAQILRLANEEADRERANAADEIAAQRAQALAETQTLRDQAQRETEDLRSRVLTDVEAQREQAQAETQALRDRVTAETEEVRRKADEQANAELEAARAESERRVAEAREAAERDVAEARAAAQEIEDRAKSESEALVTAAKEREAALIGEAERRANHINTVLGSRLEILTTTHHDVVGRLRELRGVLVDVLGAEETLGAFEVPPAPSDATVRDGEPALSDPYVQTAGEVAAAYEAAGITAGRAGSQQAVWGQGTVTRTTPADEPAAQAIEEDPDDEEPVVTPTSVDPVTRSIDLSSVEKTRH